MSDGPIVLSSVNLKGGVGKTAISVNFAAYCGLCGYKTLLIDLDPQTNASFATIGVKAWEDHASSKGTVADLLGARTHNNAEGRTRNAADVVFSNAFDNVDLIPSHVDLFTVDLDLSGATARETKLRKAIKPLKEQYDIIICDCPPNLTVPSQNALAISTHYVIPVSLDFLSAIGVGLLITRVEELSEDLEHPITNSGIILSRVGRPAQHRDATEATLRSAPFGALVFESIIKERAVVSECAARNMPIFSSRDKAAIDEFTSAFNELQLKIGLTNEDT